MTTRTYKQLSIFQKFIINYYTPSMKFSIALGLLFAGLAHSQMLSPNQVGVDGFLREKQHLKSSAQLVSIKENGPISTVTYRDGPINLKYDVRSDGDQMKVVGIQRMVTFSGNFQFNPSPAKKQNIQIEQLPPIPLLMPQFKIESNGKVQMKNVFDDVEKEISEMEHRMEQNKQEFQRSMEKKRSQMQGRINKKFYQKERQTPLIGGGDHDRNWATDVQFNPPLIGGGSHDYNWATENEIQPQHALIGGDHDYKWSNDIEKTTDHPLIGGGDHDNWKVKRENVEKDHPIIGGDDHDNWQNKKKGCKKKWQKEGDHDKKDKKHKWNKDHKQHEKQRRHHSNMAWMNKKLSKQNISIYLKDRLPDMMSNSQVIEVQQKGFQKGKGIKLNIKIKDHQDNLQEVEAFFKPMRQEFIINRISSIKQEKADLQTGKELVANIIQKLGENVLKHTNDIQPNVEVVEAKKEESKNEEIPQQFLLGGKNDPDHDITFMDMPIQVEGKQNNHIPLIKEVTYDVPLIRGQNDLDNGKKMESVIEKVMEIAVNAFEDEEMKDIEQAEQPKKEEKLQLVTQR